jgi:hypothetical protein
MTEAYGEAERQLLALTSARPWDADLMLRLGALQASLLKYPEAAETLRRAIVLAPDAPQAWHVHEGEKSTDNAFHRAAQVGAALPHVRAAVIEHFAKDAKPQIALQYIEQSFAENMQSPRIQQRYLSVLRDLGLDAQAASVCETLVQAYSNAADTATGLQREDYFLQCATLLQAAGLDGRIDASLKDAVRRIGSVTPRFNAQTTLMPQTAERIAALQAQLRGRDAFVFLPGPSAKDFIDQAPAFSGWDFASVAIAAHGDVIDSAALGPIGRAVDLLWMSNPAQLRTAEASIVAFLKRGTGIRLITQPYALGGYDRAQDFVDQFGDRMLFIEPSDRPPAPHAPLRFASGNSLSVLLQILIWGQPRRLFLIGADGGGARPNGSGRPYFYAPEVPAGGGDADRDETIDRLEILRVNELSVEDATRRFRLEAKEVDELVGLALRIFRVVFGLQIPEIYNCCPYSAHEAFPKITIAEALTMKP